MLKIDNLHVHYRLSHVIHGVTIEPRQREVVGIFGRNGVGKTTQTKTVTRLIRPSDARVRLVEPNVHGALAIADRFYAIERGAVILAGDTKNGTDEARLMEAITV